MSSRQVLKMPLGESLQVGVIRSLALLDVMHWVELFREPLVVVLRADRPLAAGSEDGLAIVALVEGPFVLFSRSYGTGLYDQIIALTRQAGFSPRTVQEASEVMTIIGLASAGLGVSIPPASFRHTRVDGVVYRTLSDPEAMTAVQLVRRQNEGSPLVLFFINPVTREAASPRRRRTVLRQGRDGARACPWLYLSSGIRLGSRRFSVRCVMFNRKGGVGESSIACNLVAVSAAEGYRTLLVGPDAQANSMHYLTGLTGENLPVGIANSFRQALSFGPFSEESRAEIYETSFDNLCIVTSSPELTDLQLKLESKHKISKLRKLLDELDEDYDRIYLDTPPALNFYMVPALIAADRRLIPFDCDSFSHQALYGLLQEIEELCDGHNEDLQVEGIAVNQFQPRASPSQQLLDRLVAEELPALPVYLMSSVKVHESHQACIPLIFLKPRHKLTQQLIELHGLLEN